MDYRSIIESKYNRQNWQSLLHDIFQNKVQFWQQPQEVVVDKKMAKSALYTGKISLSDGHIIAIYEVELSDNVVIERNRVGIRNLLLSSWRNMGCAGAFMFCFRQDEATLRFSYVSESFAFTEAGTLTKESTDTKRFTYFLGEGHRSRTAETQFEKLKKSTLDLKAITKAFSVDAVSDLFFEEYKKHYEDIIEFITGKRMVKVSNKWEEQITGEPCSQIMQQFEAFPDAEKAARDYVKKLMGRLVFIQFLQKKGWMGCSAGEDWIDGDKEFVQNLFANTTYKNTFVDDVLEPLFNDINTKRDGDLTSSPNVGVNIKIPYLNGGLFEKDDYDNTLFPLPAKYMKSMLDFFASYNFTIDENDPDDAEIGVDPEMLGRIFENLLEDNKDKGVFYTPKEIVHYMCRESLIAYLQTDIEEASIKESIRQFVTTYDASILSDNLANTIDQKLKDVKICDPAIGSGAFPMGLLRELYACRKAIEGIDDEKAVSIKSHIIQNNIYGVDIEKGAVDIARLRFWLALIVDEKNPHALPNMDFKIMQGNSLLEQYEGVDLSGMSLNEQAKRKAKKGQAFEQSIAFDENIALENIQKAIKQYYLTDSHNEKIDLRNIIDRNVKSYILNLKGCTPEIQKKLESLPIPNDKFFLWHIYFKDVFDNGGFDIVIGNPPYIKEYVSRQSFDGFREFSPYYMGKMDLWYGFACHGIDLLASNGVLCFIAQNNWTTSAGAKKLRNKIVADAQILKLLDFNTYMVFEHADIQTMIMLFEKNQTDEEYTFDYRVLENGAGKEDMIALLNKQNRKTVYRTQKFSRTKYVDKLFTFSNNEVIFDKIAVNKAYLEADEVAQGIVFPQDFLDKKNAAKLGNRFPVGCGIFGLSNEEMEKLNLFDNEKKLVKPYFSTEQIGRFYITPSNTKWLIYTDSSFKRVNSMDSYPHIKAHLDQFIDIFTSDNKPYGLHRCRKETFFQGEKIISLRKCVGQPCFSYSDFDCYVTQTFFSIKTSRWNMKFLTGVLNSKLVAFWLRHKGKMQGNNYQVDKYPLLGIPLPMVALSLQQPIIYLVDIILAKKKQNFQANTSELENEIDQIVYKLYGLTEDEIKIVEGMN